MIALSRLAPVLCEITARAVAFKNNDEESATSGFRTEANPAV